MSAVTAKTGAVKNNKSRKKKNMAESADRHALYEKSVQSVDVEYKFVSKTFRSLRGRRPVHMREDFCGTAGMCREWVRCNRNNTAIDVDIDPEVLAWGQNNNLSSLKPEARLRVRLLQEDVGQLQTKPVSPGSLCTGRSPIRTAAREPVFTRLLPGAVQIRAGFVSWWLKSSEALLTPQAGKS
jgi:hypothetical protein